MKKNMFKRFVKWQERQVVEIIHCEMLENNTAMSHHHHHEIDKCWKQIVDSDERTEYQDSQTQPPSNIRESSLHVKMLSDLSKYSMKSYLYCYSCIRLVIGVYRQSFMNQPFWDSLDTLEWTIQLYVQDCQNESFTPNSNFLSQTHRNQSLRRIRNLMTCQMRNHD